MLKKTFKVIAIILCILLVIFALAVTYISKELPDVGPAPIIKIDPTPRRLQRGRYLALYVTGCNDCHSTRNHRLYSAPVIPGTSGKGGEIFRIPEGIVVASNISPLALADWTDGEIFRALTTGVNKSGKALFPIMPYQNFAKMDTEDVYSIIAYLRTWNKQAAGAQHTYLKFPMNILLHTIPKKTAPGVKPDSSDLVAYGKYMLTASNCRDCHSPMERGKFLAGLEFSGGRQFHLPGVTVTAANITPDKRTGIGTWTKEAFIQRFKIALDSSYLHPIKKNESQTVMPWPMYAHMTENDLAAIYAYLRTVTPVNKPITKFR